MLKLIASKKWILGFRKLQLRFQLFWNIVLRCLVVGNLTLEEGTDILCIFA
jgi:hypothetical protein